jgi:outer membrane receptor protein involved in Fe transport
MNRFSVRRAVGGLITVSALWLVAAPLCGQATGTVQGTVVEAGTGNPIEAAQVYLEGRGVPVATDAGGNFTLTNVPVGSAVVRVRVIGYSTVGQAITVSAMQPAMINFELERTVIQLDQIVVTGTGREVERRKLSATVDVVNLPEIERASATDVAELLQGRIAGATVNATSAQAGTSGLVNFRGVTSVFGSQTPVIYVDGIRVDNADATTGGTGGEQSSALADLLVNDIDRVEVTKGGAASTLYGSDAASGVIQIFTKRGTPGAPRVTARIEQGFDRPELKYIFDTGFIYPDEIENGADPEWLHNNFFKTGHFQNYYLGASGGQANLTYSVSGRVQHDDGVQPKNEDLIFNLRGAVQADISDKVNVNFNANYTRNRFGRLFNGTAIADPLTSFEVGDVFFFSGQDNFADAQRIFTLPEIDERVNRFRFGAGIDYRPSPFFSGRGTIGLDFRTNEQRQFSPIGALIVNNGRGELFRYQRDFTSVTLDVAGTVSYPYDGPVTSDFTVGAQGFRDDIATTSVDGEDFALPGAPDFDEAANVTATESNTEIFNGGIYFQEEIGLVDRLFLNAGLRLDANSTFGDDVQLEAYPKLGASYIVSDEPFFFQALGGIVNTLKLRAAYGQTGKFPAPFLRDRSFNATQFRGLSAPRFNNPGNVDLGPEVTATFEPGFDLAVWDQRVAVEFTYFDAKTTDAMMFVPEQPVTGLGSQLRNVGEITNTGIELAMNLQVLRSPNVSWDVGATYHTVRNRVTDLGDQPAFNIAGTGGQQRVEVGHPVGAWRVFTPYDSNGDGMNDADSLTFSGGQPTPTKTGSFNTNVTVFNNLTFSASLDWATGHQVFDWGSVWATFNGIFRRELVEFDDANGNGIRDEDGDGNYTESGFDFPIQYDTDGTELGPYAQNAARSAFLVDGDWLKLRSVSVRYALPSSLTGRFGLERATVYVSGRNLKIWSKTPMIDPELNGVRAGGNLALGGESSVTLSPSKAFRFGLEVTF